MSDYSRPQTAEETEEEALYDTLENTPVSTLIERGITLSELRVLIHGDEFKHTAIALARRRKFTHTPVHNLRRV